MKRVGTSPHELWIQMEVATPIVAILSTITQRRMELSERIQALPEDVQRHILSFVRWPVKPNPQPLPANTQQHVEKLQKSPKSKRTPMDLKGLEDFVIQ